MAPNFDLSLPVWHQGTNLHISLTNLTHVYRVMESALDHRLLMIKRVLKPALSQKLDNAFQFLYLARESDVQVFQLGARSTYIPSQEELLEHETKRLLLVQQGM